MQSDTRPNCNECASFFVTHKPSHPYGCRAFGMHSKALPSIAVRRNSGAECRAFTPKNKPTGRKPGGLYG